MINIPDCQGHSNSRGSYFFAKHSKAKYTSRSCGIGDDVFGGIGDFFHFAEYRNLELKGEEGDKENRMIKTCPRT